MLIGSMRGHYNFSFDPDCLTYGVILIMIVNLCILIVIVSPMEGVEEEVVNPDSQETSTLTFKRQFCQITIFSCCIVHI